MAYLNDPSPCFLLRIAPFEFSFCPTVDDMSDVSTVLDSPKTGDVTIPGISTEMFVSAKRWIIPLDGDGIEHFFEAFMIIDIGSGHDDRQRDATTVHQEVALASFFSPDPSGWDQRPLEPKGLSSSIHRRFAIARRSPPSRRTQQGRLSREPRRSLLLPIQESVCGRSWRCRIALGAKPSIGTQSAGHKRWPRRLGGRALGADRLQAFGCIAFLGRFPWEEPTAPPDAKTHLSLPTMQPAVPRAPSPPVPTGPSATISLFTDKFLANVSQTIGARSDSNCL